MTRGGKDFRGTDLPRVVRVGRAAWSMLGVVGLIAAAWFLISRLTVVVVPVVLAVVVAAALNPIVELLRKLRVPRPIAAFIAVLLGLAAVAGAVWLVVPRFLAKLPDLISSLSSVARRINQFLASLPFLGSDVNAAGILQRALSEFFSGGGTIPAALGRVVTVLAALFLLLVVVLFYLGEGRWLASALISWLPDERQDELWGIAVGLWHIVGRYFQALLLVALFDAVFIGLGLWILDVPLVIPLSVIIYIGAFLPYIGAFVSGLLAVLVALAERGLITALLVLAVIVLVQQIEGNIIQPLIMGQIVQLPAFMVLLAITAGAALLGILGAFLAVPVAACTQYVLQHMYWRARGHEP